MHACPTGMVFIPSGQATIGTPGGRGESAEHKQANEECECGVETLVWEEKLQSVAMSAFCMDRTAVTVANYARCAEASVCGPIHLDADPECKECNSVRPGREQYPINGVTFENARAYCKWVGKSLPTGHQWEYAARGIEGRRFPWGDELPSIRVMSAGAVSGHALGESPVGSYPAGASAFGVLELLGQLSEWTLPDDSGSVRVGHRRAYPPYGDRDSKATVWSTTRVEWDSMAAHPSDGFRCVAEIRQ